MFPFFCYHESKQEIGDTDRKKWICVVIDGRIRTASLCFHNIIYSCPYYQFSKYSTGRLRTREQICAIYSRCHLILSVLEY